MCDGSRSLQGLGISASLFPPASSLSSNDRAGLATRVHAGVAGGSGGQQGPRTPPRERTHDERPSPRGRSFKDGPPRGPHLVAVAAAVVVVAGHRWALRNERWSQFAGPTCRWRLRQDRGAPLEGQQTLQRAIPDAALALDCCWHHGARPEIRCCSWRTPVEERLLLVGLHDTPRNRSDDDTC